MRMTAAQYDALGLTSEEYDSLKLSAKTFGKISYGKFLDLIKIHLSKNIPQDPTNLLHYAKNMHVTMELMHTAMEEGKRRAPIGYIITALCSIFFNLIASYVWWKFGPL